MSRRRRQLAAPFVAITLGACGPQATTTRNPPPPEQQPEQPPETYDQNGDKIDGDRPPVVVNPPPPESLPDPPADGQGDVITREDGTCWYIEKVECVPDATCNPPRPLQVKCPEPDK